MRSEVLYQYDLPLELLEEISQNEEILEVIFARSKEKYLVPLLITRDRIVWAYPETSTVYRVYELQFVDILSVVVKYTAPVSYSTLSLETVNKQVYLFSNLKDDKVGMRGALLTLLELLNKFTDGGWVLSGRKTLLNDELWLDKHLHKDFELISRGSYLMQPVTDAVEEDIFEEKSLPGKGCFESNETLFSHFSKEGEEVFEETPRMVVPSAHEKDVYAAADEKVARLVEAVEAEVALSRRNDTTSAVSPAPETENCVVYGPRSGEGNDQWKEHSGGDAMILTPRPRFLSLRPDKKTEYRPEDDDSVIYPTTNADTIEVTSEQLPAQSSPFRTEKVIITPFKAPAPVSVADGRVINPVEPIKPGYTSSDEKTPVFVDAQNPSTTASAPLVKKSIPTPDNEQNQIPNRQMTPQKTLREAVPLEPAEGFNMDQVDKLLGELKHLRDNGIISEKEYRERSLRLFRDT